MQFAERKLGFGRLPEEAKTRSAIRRIGGSEGPIVSMELRYQPKSNNACIAAFAAAEVAKHGGPLGHNKPANWLEIPSGAKASALNATK